MYIKDTYTGNVRKYGTDMHDSLRISNDGTCLTYHHLQCGDGSIEGDKEHSGFLFCDDEGHTPEEDEVLCRNGADAFFNIGGWKEPKWIPISESLPELDEDGYSTYVLVSFSNYSLPCIGQLRKTDGENHWYEGDDEKALDSFGLHVNAWMPLPEPYKAESEGKK
jgi:hypothetical protein